MRAILSVALLALLGTIVPSLARAPVPKGDFAIDPRHTQVIFSVRHLGLSTFYGRFGKIAGTLHFDPDAPEASTLNVQIDMSVIQTHVDELDQELAGSFFHAAKFPQATFTATKIIKTGDNTGTVTGSLTLVGVTRPVSMNVTFNGGRPAPIPFQPYRIGFDATGTIKRSDFGLTGTIWSGFVSDDVSLIIECEMERQ